MQNPKKRLAENLKNFPTQYHNTLEFFTTSKSLLHDYNEQSAVPSIERKPAYYMRPSRTRSRIPVLRFSGSEDPHGL